MNEARWDELYDVPEHPKLPGSGLPMWHYEEYICLDCSSPLINCRNNPYGRLSARAQARRDAYEAYLLANVYTDNADIEQVREDNASKILELHRAGKTITQIRQQLRLQHPEIAKVLADNGVVISRGRPKAPSTTV